MSADNPLIPDDPRVQAVMADVVITAILLRATAALLDVVQELAQGLAAGQTPESDWAEIVVDTFDKHRAELRGEVVEWEPES